MKKYYPSMDHEIVKEMFRKKLMPETYQAVADILDFQYTGDVGYNPGSQMVQIAGISLLDDLDHYCKERLHTKHYMRYMDDILIIHHNKEELEAILEEIKMQLDEIGFRVHEEKTHITPLSKGFLWLGFEYRITDTGKVIMTLNSANIKHERRKLRKLVKLAKEGRITKAKVDECYKSWKANASKGNSYKLIQRMDEYYAKLWEETADEN